MPDRYLTRYGKRLLRWSIRGHIMLYIGNTTMNGQVVADDLSEYLGLLCLKPC